MGHLLTPRVAILDYGCGNLASVANAVRKVGGEPLLVTEPVTCVNERPTHYILPGQGHYGQAVETLASQGWLGFLRGPRGDFLKPNRPILGICLGMQLMCEGSEEAPGVKGLGWLPFNVTKLPFTRSPHIGWSTVWYARLDRFEGDLGRIRPAADFYFCHSYGINKKEIYSRYYDPEWFDIGLDGESIPNGAWEYIAEIRQGNLWAVQFHPEKSGRAGLALLAEFLRL